MILRVTGRRSTLLVMLILLGLAAPPARAQYFGQNKVQYHNLKFEVLKTQHFDIYYYPREKEGADIAARLAERWHTRLERVFGHRLRGRQPLILYASSQDFQQTNVISGQLGEGTGGVTEPLRRRIILPMGGPLADTDHVIGHELVHAFQFDMTTRPGMGPGENGAERLPLWFIEGMAEYLSLGPVDPNTAMWLRDAVQQDKLPAIKDLNDPKYFPYRWGQAFWAYVGGRWGDRTVGQLLSEAAGPSSLNDAIEKVLGVKTPQLSTEWQASIRKTYASTLEAMSAPASAGRLVIKGKETGGDLNVGPAISPDGKWIAFLSDRSFFSADLYIADAATGRIVHRLTSTATDPHYSSLEFIYSAGAWDDASQRLAVAAVTGGRTAIAIFNAATGKEEREIPVPSVDEVLNPAWSPDGETIAFTGMTQGVTDLFVVTLGTGTVRQLTDDPFADLQPAWSPDGKRIAFATDRFTTSLNTLAIGAYRIGLFDMDGGVIEQAPGFADGKHLNPQWSPDGQALYFISDRDGIPNIYRVPLAGGDIVQVTTIATGVSGITAESPALSVSPKAGTLAFSVYEGGKYDIYAIGSPVPSRPLIELSANAAVLPPLDRKPSDVEAVLQDPTFGLPDTQTFPTGPYRAKLSLESVGQPVVGVGVSRFGPTVGGGLSMYFGDLLENHQLGVAVQANSGYGGNFSAKNISAEAMYLNQAHRWNWGVAGGQLAYLSGGFQSAVGQTQTGDLVQSDQLITYRQTEQSGTGIVAYPFDRARRVEFSGGASHISFDQVVNTTTYSLVTGAVYNQSTQTTPLAQSLTLGTASAAYVFDTSSFGATSPVEGQRYRLEVDPTVGTLRFNGVLADYRRYFMPVPFYTFGVRVMHYGRYGSGGEDPRLFPLYIGYPGLVRGYDVTTINSNECVPNATSSCPVIDRLLGSRMLIGNLEFRFPLLRPFGVSRHMYGPLPVEVALFTDGGVAWTSAEKPSIFGGSRKGVSSAGVAFRVNVFGYVVAEFDVVKPFQRPTRGWTFAFNFLQGW